MVGFCCFSEAGGELGGESGLDDGGFVAGMERWALAFADARTPFKIDSRRFGGKGGGDFLVAIF